MDKKITFQVDLDWIKKAIQWAEQDFSYMAYFDHNSLTYPYMGFENTLYAGNEAFTLEQVNTRPSFHDKVGILSYDLKNKFEILQSQHTPYIDCPDSVFFQPTLKIVFKNQQAEIEHPEPLKIYEKINSFTETISPTVGISLSSCTPKKDYIKNVLKIKEHIREGDIYEMNYCIAYKGTFNSLNLLDVFWKLMEKSPMPFSSFFKAKDKIIIGSSPERFLKKTGAKIIAQPIKGTIKRGKTEEEDQLLRLLLKNSEKECAENLMIVDLMRNDLSKISEIGKVQVEELFGIYPFKSITQMISTVSSTLKQPIKFENIIANTFPMGSMTGAPKIKCMELIDKYENFRRGWFSGSMGYISKNQDFDFNVVIRSIILDMQTCRLYFAVGSAITYDADPEQEYQECLLKAQPILEVLSEI